ncbi:MAG: PEGA domain-containing protein [Opitutales bacterium]
MRIHVSLLAFCVALVGCKSSVDSANIDSIVISSNPSAAAVRINGEAVGRTPTTIKLDRTKNYELQVGKGGYLTETSDLKPRLITTSEGIEFGFPAAIRVNLTKVPAAGEPGVPASDNPEFKRLSKKALGEEAAAKQELMSDIAATKDAAVKIQAALAAREAAAQARLAEISKSLAAAKAAKNKDAAAKAKLAEAEIALAQANAEAAAARAAAEKNLKTVEARRAALAASEGKVAQAQAVVAQSKAAVKSDEGRLAMLEQTYAAEMKALKDSQANASIAIKALAARADELTKRSASNVKEVQVDSAKALTKAQQELAAQKAAAAKAQADADAKVAAQKAAAAKAQADADAKVAAANKAAEKAVADARLDAEAKLAEANKAAAAAKAQADALKYSEFSSRYALLESKRRSKAISEEDFKAALTGLRKELGL